MAFQSPAFHMQRFAGAAQFLDFWPVSPRLCTNESALPLCLLNMVWFNKAVIKPVVLKRFVGPPFCGEKCFSHSSIFQHTSPSQFTSFKLHSPGFFSCSLQLQTMLTLGGDSSCHDCLCTCDVCSSRGWVTVLFINFSMHVYTLVR